MIYRQTKSKTQKKLPNPQRKCINCPALHQNNQPYCSQECCEQHRQNTKVQTNGNK